MATAAKKINDGITATTPLEENMVREPTVRVFIPLAEDSESDLAVDQTEHVTINGVVTSIRRGEYVNVKVPVYMQLKNRYPNL